MGWELEGNQMSDEGVGHGNTKDFLRREEEEEEEEKGRSGVTPFEYLSQLLGHLLGVHLEAYRLDEFENGVL